MTATRHVFIILISDMKPQFFIAIITILFFQCGCFNGSKSNLTCADVKNNYQSIVDTSIDKSALIAQLEVLTQRTPDCIDGYILKGDLYFSTNKKKANLAYRAAVNIDSNNVYALFESGVTYELLSKYDSALYYYNWSMRKKERNGYVADLSKEVKKVASKRIYDVDYYNIVLRHGIASYFERDFVSSMMSLNYCIKNNYHLDQSLFFRGLLYLEIEEREKACKDLDEARKSGNAEAEEVIAKNCK
jgi:tetratricopeptide (TPR) repeat protein